MSVQPRVLIVDDEPDLRELLRLELEGHGWQVEEAANGRDAWRLLQSRDVDVVLTDLRMPGGSGLELVEKLRERGAPPPEIFLMSAYADVSLEQTRSLGAHPLLAKPFDFEGVARTLGLALGRG